MSEDYKNMLKFGQDVFLEGLQKYLDQERLDWVHKRNEIIRGKRLAVVSCVHGVELILKAILLKKDYVIYKIKGGIFKNKSDIKDLLNEDRTIDLNEVLNFFKKEYKDLDSSALFKLKDLRNQIVHHGVRINEKKKVYFLDAIAYLEGLYKKECIKNRTFLKKIRTMRDSI